MSSAYYPRGAGGRVRVCGRDKRALYKISSLSMSGRRLRRAPRGVSVTHWSSPESYVWLHLSHKVAVWPAEARNTLLGDGPHLYCLCLCLLSGRSLHLVRDIVVRVVVAILARIHHIEHGMRQRQQHALEVWNSPSGAMCAAGPLGVCASFARPLSYVVVNFLPRVLRRDAAAGCSP